VKKLLGIVVLGLLWCNVGLAGVSASNLSSFYDGCMQGAKNKGEYGKGLKVCTCAVEQINQKLSNSEFENIFLIERYKADLWMMENVAPYCN